MHYGRWYRWGDPEASDHRSGKFKGGCSIEGCENEHSAKGLCKTHYVAQRRPVAGADYECQQCLKVFTAERKRGVGERVFCSRKCKQDWYNSQPGKREDMLRRYYIRRYGLTLEEAQAMRERGCDICGRSEVSGRWENNLHIDHDHTTGKVRGVLCHGCNVAIGHFRDDPGLLTKAIAYLQR